MMEKMVHTAKHSVNAKVEIPRARNWSRRAGAAEFAMAYSNQRGSDGSTLDSTSDVKIDIYQTR